jgi:multidrug efflux pump subunit AcrA (membrane-fusion protein)
MAHQPQRIGIGVGRRSVVAVGLAASAISAGGAIWKAIPAVDQPSQTDTTKTYVIRLHPFAVTVGVVGTIVPGDSVDVVAPFDGVVKEASIKYGAMVEAGQVLLVMDDFEILQRRREAETAHLKAVEADAEMASWSTGPEMSRARRAVTAAELALQITRRKALETKSLLDRGLVARMEYDALVQQEHTEAMVLTAAREDLAIVQKKGEGSSRHVSAIALQNARARLDDLTAQLAGATVRAPAAGIIVQPPAERNEQAQSPIRVGQQLTRGKLIGTIAKSNGLAIAIKLDEVDANRVKEGQAATVASRGFPGLILSGQVRSVAGEGTVGDPSRGSSFSATVRIASLTPEQATVVRIGMSANVTIMLYQKTSATTVPPEALRGTPAMPSVVVQDGRSGLIETRRITVGAVAPDAVEVLSGLSVGDVVIWKAPAERTIDPD